MILTFCFNPRDLYYQGCLIIIIIIIITTTTTTIITKMTSDYMKCSNVNVAGYRLVTQLEK